MVLANDDSMYKYKIIVVYLFIITNFSCSTNRDVKSIEVIYQKRNDVVEYFKGLSVFKRGTIIGLTIYDSNLRNEYFFDELTLSSGKTIFVLFRDSLQFDIADIERFQYINQNDSVYKESMTQVLLSVLDKMQSLNINSVTSDFSSHGIALKFYFKDHEMFYVPKLEAVQNIEWQKYVKSANKIDDNWYWGEYGH